MDAGASVVGIAASKDFVSAPEGYKPADQLNGCCSVIVLGAPFPQEALSKNTVEYTEIRNEMVKKMDAIAKVGSSLNQVGNSNFKPAASR